MVGSIKKPHQPASDIIGSSVFEFAPVDVKSGNKKYGRKIEPWILPSLCWPAEDDSTGFRASHVNLWKNENYSYSQQGQELNWRVTFANDNTDILIHVKSVCAKYLEHMFKRYFMYLNTVKMNPSVLSFQSSYSKIMKKRREKSTKILGARTFLWITLLDSSV